MPIVFLSPASIVDKVLIDINKVNIHKRDQSLDTAKRQAKQIEETLLTAKSQTANILSHAASAHASNIGRLNTFHEVISLLKSTMALKTEELLKFKIMYTNKLIQLNKDAEQIAKHINEENTKLNDLEKKIHQYREQSDEFANAIAANDFDSLKKQYSKRTSTVEQLMTSVYKLLNGTMVAINSNVINAWKSYDSLIYKMKRFDLQQISAPILENVRGTLEGINNEISTEGKKFIMWAECVLSIVRINTDIEKAKTSKHKVWQ